MAGLEKPGGVETAATACRSYPIHDREKIRIHMCVVPLVRIVSPERTRTQLHKKMILFSREMLMAIDLTFIPKHYIREELDRLLQAGRF